MSSVRARNTPGEPREVANRASLDGDALVRTSRLTARIDNNAIADGFQIYLHSFVLSADGDWAIVQQGMNGASRLARRDGASVVLLACYIPARRAARIDPMVALREL